MTVPEQAVEAAAQVIYNRLPYNERWPSIKPPWVAGGNSLKKDEARRYARAALEAAQPLMGVQRPEDVARLIWNGFAARMGGDFDRAKGTVAYEHCCGVAAAVLALPHTGQPQEGCADLETIADAIDAARYAHPDHPRERPRPFVEADRGDREYATRLARAARAVIATAFQHHQIGHAEERAFSPAPQAECAKEGWREALRWYGDEAEALANKLNGMKVSDNPAAIEASLTVLALDGGRRAREALSAPPAIVADQRPEVKP